MLLVHNLRLAMGAPPQAAVQMALQKLKLPAGAVKDTQLHKVSVDARRKPPTFVCSVAVVLKEPEKERRLAAKRKDDVRLVQPQPYTLRPGARVLAGPVVVCGMGPAGLFCALELAKAGYAPLVLERGPDIDTRTAAVQRFNQTGQLSPHANIQFGEGGAGTFSDGKLTTRISDPLCHVVLQSLLEAGAPEEIAWQNRPHIGTDVLRGVFKALRGQLISHGGRVRFGTALEQIAPQKGEGLQLQAGGGTLAAGALVLACGHSARDTFAALPKAGLQLLPKPFSVGFRIEHLQADIDSGLYHELAGHPALPPGEYQLSARVGGRGVYTFCMCPGGSVVAAASEEGGVVTNGMSLHARAGKNANAAVVAGVNAADFGTDPLAAVAWQRGLEQAAFAAGGGGYTAPAETLDSFMKGDGKLSIGRIQPSYPRGARAFPLAQLLPAPITAALREGLAAFGRKLPGYTAPDAVLTGLETRTSSPVRIPRGEDGQAPGVPGLYPCGEGAGYAGGIMSAAVDGIRTAHAIISTYAPPRGAVGQ